MEDPPSLPTAETDLNVSPEWHLDEPPDHQSQNLEIETRGKTPKSELWVEIKPVSPDRKPHEQDDVDKRAGSEDRAVSPGLFEIRPSQGIKRLPWRALKYPPSHGGKRLPLQGAKQLPSYGLKHPDMPLRKNEGLVDRSSPGDEGFFYPDGANISILGVVGEG